MLEVHVITMSLFGNTLCTVRFSSPFQAERAAIEPVIFLGSGLDSHVMLSITRLNSSLARSLNLHMDANGSFSLSLDSRTASNGLRVTSPFPSSRHVERGSRPVEGPGINLQLR